MASPIYIAGESSWIFFLFYSQYSVISFIFVDSDRYDQCWIYRKNEYEKTICQSACGYTFGKRLLFSCHDKMNKNTGALQFDSIQVNETAHLFNDTAKPACNIIINFAYPVKSSDEMLKDSLNAYFISVCFGDKYIGEKPEAVVKQYAKNYIDEYRHDQEPMYAEDEKNKESDAVVGAWYSYYKSIESHVQLYEKDLLVYRVDYNEYTGGAHGMYMSTFLNMDLTLMRPLRLDDIL